MIESDPFLPEVETQDPEVMPRVPHMGHALLLAALILMLLLITQMGALTIAGYHFQRGQTAPTLNPKQQLGSMAVTYIVALLAAMLVFPKLWRRGFGTGIQWNGAAALRLAVRLIPLGLALNFAVQVAENVVTAPKAVPMDKFFTTASDVWLVAGFGTLLAPLMEEVFFRGFLLPACAIGFDWMTLKRDPDVYAQWASTETVTRQGYVFSGIVTSGLFAWLHAAQLGYTWSSVAILFCVSLVLTAVRVGTKSVACSTLLHASYNFTVFLVLFFGTDGFRHLEKIKG